MLSNQHQLFDIDLDELEAIRKSVGATPKEMVKAYGRALARTAVTVRKLSSKHLKEELQAKSAKVIRNRLKQFKIKATGNNLDELKLWYGLNPLPVSSLKGRIKRIGTKRSPNGASFSPSSSSLKAETYDKGFIARLNGPRSIYLRTGKGKWNITEAKVDINDEIHVAIEDEIFSLIPEIFIKHFTTDLKGRVAIRK